MGHRISYSRIGNVEPVYKIEPQHEPDDFALFASVVEVVRALPRYHKKSVRLACKEAREEGFSDFLA